MIVLPTNATGPAFVRTPAWRRERPAPINPAPADGERDIVDDLDDAARARLSHPLLSRARQRIGKERFPTFSIDER